MKIDLIPNKVEDHEYAVSNLKPCQCDHSSVRWRGSCSSRLRCDISCIVCRGIISYAVLNEYLQKKLETVFPNSGVELGLGRYKPPYGLFDKLAWRDGLFPPLIQDGEIVKYWNGNMFTTVRNAADIFLPFSSSIRTSQNSDSFYVHFAQKVIRFSNHHSNHRGEYNYYVVENPLREETVVNAIYKISLNLRRRKDC